MAELDGAGSVVAQFIHGYKDGAPAYIIKGGKTYRVIADHLSSPRLVIDTVTGEVVQRMDYDEYGNVNNDTNPGFQPFAFAGGLYDQHTKLTRFGARDYDANNGRWVIKDPIGYAEAGFNTYDYSYSDPINYYDLDGMEPSACVAGATALGAIGGGFIGRAGGGYLGFAAGTATGVPVVGNIAGGIAGQALGGLAGASGGAALGNAAGQALCPKQCPECVPPVGTIGYRFDPYPSKPHRGVSPHYHLYIMQQNPNNCQCFWAPMSDGPYLPPWWQEPIGPAKGGSNG